MNERTIFFYGLFMNEQILKREGVNPRRSRMAELPGFDIVVRDRAAILPWAGASVWGMATELLPEEIRMLYADNAFRRYEARTVSVHPLIGKSFPALCYTPAVSEPGTPDLDYLEALIRLATSLCLPRKYVRRLGRLCS